MLLLGICFLSACGGGGNNASTNPLTISGNWQFTMAPPPDNSFLGGLEGGFLQQSSGSVNGSLAYSVSLPPGSNQPACNSGSAAVSGTVDGQIVTITAVAGTQTFSLSGTLSYNALTMDGTYDSTPGTAQDGSPCGTAQSGLQWHAVFVPELSGSIQGTVHSGGGSAGLNEQEFLVSGSLAQAANSGASSASVTGVLNFINPLLQVSDYPCIASASLSGQISGNTVTLQILGVDESIIGQIGGSGLQLVTFDNTQSGYVVHSIGSPAYAVYASECGGGTLEEPADFGNICLGLNGSTACSAPVTFAPAALMFNNQQVGTADQQTVTLTNSSKSALSNLTLVLTDDTGLGVYLETDQCGPGGAPSNGDPFNLSAGQSCVITITYTPQCGDPCSSTQTATLSLYNPNGNAIFNFPISGTLEPGSRAMLDPRQLQASWMRASIQKGNATDARPWTRRLGRTKSCRDRIET